MLSDFPKVACPFIRQTLPIDNTQWKEHGSKLHLRSPEVYLVIDKINPGYEWVIDDKDTFAVEKLNGTNVKIKTEGGRLVAMQNRLNVIDPLQVIKGKTFLIEGVFQAIGKEYVLADGEQAGEIIGPKLQGNPYKLDTHLWYPFERTITDLRYKSFDAHERTLANWSAWFETHLYSRFFTKRASKLGLTENVFAEGVIFYNLRRRSENKSWMAKLRRDMFPWYYAPHINLDHYNPQGQIASIEDQAKFE